MRIPQSPGFSRSLTSFIDPHIEHGPAASERHITDPHQSVNGVFETVSGADSLETDVTRYVHQRKGYDDTVVHDWLSGTSYTDQRKDELGALPSGKIPAAHYGVSITKEQSAKYDFSPQMRFASEGSGGYHRMTPPEFLHDKCRALYAAKQQAQPPEAIIFVNSEYAARKLSAGIPHERKPGQKLKQLFRPRTSSKPPYTKLHEGIFAVPFGKMVSAQEMDDRLFHMGARVSPTLIERALSASQPAVISMPGVDNVATLKQFEEAAAGPLAKLAALPAEHPASAQAGVIVSLVQDLQKVLNGSNSLKRHRGDPILSNGLTALSNMLQALPTQHHDNQRFSNGYVAVMEELKVILSAACPYDQTDYKVAASEQLLGQLDPKTRGYLDSLTSTYMTTSGMNAIDQGLMAAQALSGRNEVEILRDENGRESRLYFETLPLLGESGTALGTGAVTLYADLHSSSRGEGDWSGGKDIATALQRYLNVSRQPLTLVLDRTVERREDMPELMKELAPAIDEGKLRLVLCKSHQKFSSMGSAKVAAGNVTVLAKADGKTAAVNGLLQENEAELEWMAPDERQLMTHFLRSGQHEYALFDKAVANANFLHRQCFSSPEQVPAIAFNERLPFLQISDYKSDDDKKHWPAFMVKSAAPGVSDKLITMHPSSALSQALIPYRGSFGFPTTSFMDISEMGILRFSLGQESKAELIEHFYMLARLQRPDVGTIGCASVCAHIEHLIDQALNKVSATFPEQETASVPMSLAEKMVAIGHNEAMGVSDHARLHDGLTDLRVALKKDQNENRPFTLNKIVSTLGALATIAEHMPTIELETSRERPQLDAMLESVIKSGMLGVSPTGRNQIFLLQARLCQADMDLPVIQSPVRKSIAAPSSTERLQRHEPSEQNKRNIARQQSAVNTLITTMERMPAARPYFMERCKIPNQVMDNLSGECKARLVELLFGSLPTNTQEAFLKRPVQAGNEHFISVCKISVCSPVRPAATLTRKPNINTAFSALPRQTSA